MPSDEAYPTAVLPPQTELQVWRHDPNGWLAVRPPAGSFSLIEAKHLQTTTDPNVYTVTTDRAKAWVGTEVDDDHTPISQVRLRRDERVAVISSLIIQEQGGEQTWYQIEPPAGEFRWVHQDDLRPGSVAYQPPSRRSADVNRPQAPADAPMSGFMPPVGAGRVGGGGPVDLPPLELDPTAAGQGWGAGSNPSASSTSGGGTGADPLAGQWRPAQQTTPVLGYVDPTADPAPTTGGWNASLVGHSGASSNDSVDALVQAQASPWGGAGSAAPGDAWDAAVNRLRQDPVASALAEQGPVAAAGSLSAGSLSAGSRAGDVSGVVGGSAAAFPTTGAGALSGGLSTTGMGSNGAGEWNQTLLQVQTRLTQELSLPQANWNLVPLLEQCRELWRTAPTPAQRQSAETVGRQIEEWIQRQWTRPGANDLTAQANNLVGSNGDPWAGQRFASATGFVGNGTPAAGSGSSGTGGNTNNSNLGGNPNPFVLAPGVVPPTSAGNPQTAGAGIGSWGRGAAPGATSFDAVGYLKELLIARGQTREYVLQDDNGRSICHLAAQPGVNLQPFLDKKVGVIGIKGIHGRLNLPHVNVERIYPVQ